MEMKKMEELSIGFSHPMLWEWFQNNYSLEWCKIMVKWLSIRCHGSLRPNLQPIEKIRLQGGINKKALLICIKEVDNKEVMASFWQGDFWSHFLYTGQGYLRPSNCQPV